MICVVASSSKPVPSIDMITGPELHVGEKLNMTCETRTGLDVILHPRWLNATAPLVSFTECTVTLLVRVRVCWFVFRSGVYSFIVVGLVVVCTWVSWVWLCDW